jgi:hypothetical protein
VGDIKSIVEAIEARMVALSFVQTEEVFDFDSVPDSVVDKAFRVVPEPVENQIYLNYIENPLEMIHVWIAYKLYRKPRTVEKTAIDDRETIWKDLVNASSISGLSSDPLLTYAGHDMTEYNEAYMVSHLYFQVDYIRDVSPS